MGEFFSGYDSRPERKAEKFKLIEYINEHEHRDYALVDENNYLIMCGDSYYEYIKLKIEYFFEGLDFAGMRYEVENITKEGIEMMDDFYDEGIYKG